MSAQSRKSLEAFARHCRTMAESTPETRVDMDVPRPGGGWRRERMAVGALTDTERALWRRLANEVAAYLDADTPDDVTLPDMEALGL